MPVGLELDDVPLLVCKDVCEDVRDVMSVVCVLVDGCEFVLDCDVVDDVDVELPLVEVRVGVAAEVVLSDDIVELSGEAVVPVVVAKIEVESSVEVSVSVDEEGESVEVGLSVVLTYVALQEPK